MLSTIVRRWLGKWNRAEFQQSSGYEHTDCLGELFGRGRVGDDLLNSQTFVVLNCTMGSIAGRDQEGRPRVGASFHRERMRCSQHVFRRLPSVLGGEGVFHAEL